MLDTYCYIVYLRETLIQTETTNLILPVGNHKMVISNLHIQQLIVQMNILKRKHMQKFK